jgi:peptidoglycan/LPS O-acetylase OafA/YrhL
MRNPKHYNQIDGLRAVAVIPVMIVHCWPTALPGAGVGVDLFFVISGFVITNLLLTEFSETQSISIKNFYIRRALRIMPALLSVCFAVSAFIVSLAVFEHSVAPLSKLAIVIAALSSTMNWARAFDITGGSLLGHSWSLSIEEQFYLVWPLTLLFFLKRNISKSKLLAGVILTILFIITWRALLLGDNANFSRVTNGTDTRADEIIIGCSLALSGVQSSRTWIAKFWFIPMLALLACMTFSRYDDPLLYQTGYLVVMFSSAWLVLLARDESTAYMNFLQTKLFLWIGRRSYSLYLWHFPIIVGLNMLGFNGAFWGAVCFIGSFFIADASYRLIERPALYLKDRLKAGSVGLSPVPGQ